ncbi:Plasmodium variant antigen protein Cir/Yir/Bir, putative [Plasmodium chabaudi adami]|uniref:Plasmodium variant antigen protein Cir/Yir/Bir, putative n=1 Tax=Plasmodium chabaudi adami TaxID=5826 RepID=A0A1C6WGE2_PLACE|nr:Plasmodium variant antigen protein Cir/Yir/Bir, putative [Plasmodium chabaudi adami]
MNHEILCGLLLEGDSYFNDENVDTQKFNKHTTIKSYCRNGGCKTNEEHINALAAYIIMLFKSSIKNDEYSKYDESLLMWISDKLFKMHLKRKGKKYTPEYMDGTTLNQAYEKYLKKHKVILDYWDLLGIIPGLKNANLKYMAEFYLLLNNICKTIAYYNDNSVESKKLSKISGKCLIQYITLYINISECKSYLHLLNKLKGIYDDFRVSAIRENDSNNNLATNLKKLTKPNGEEMEAVRSFKSYKFSNQKCYPQKKNTKPKKQGSPGLPQPPKEPLKQDSSKPAPPSPQEPQRETQQSSSTTPHEDPPTKLKLPSSSQESQELGKNNQNELTDSSKETGSSKSEIKGPEVEKGKKNGEDKEPGDPSGGKGSQVNGGDRANSESGGADTEKGGLEGRSADKVSETGDHGNGKGATKSGTGGALGGKGDTGGGAGTPISGPGDGQGTDVNGPGGAGVGQGDPGSVTRGTGGGSVSQIGDTGGGEGGANINQGGSGTNQGGSVTNQRGSPDGGTEGMGGITDDGKVCSNDGMGDQANTGSRVGAGGEPGGTCDLQDDHGSQEGSDGDKGSQEGPGGSENGPSSEKKPTDSDSGEKETQNASWPPFDIKPYMLIIKLKGMEQINNALNFFNEHKERITDAIDTINSLYNTSVSNLKNTFNNFTDFFNNFINNLSIDYNQLEKTPDSGDKQSGSGGTGDNPPTPIVPSELPKDSGDNEPGSDGKEGEPPTSNDSSQSQKDSPQHDSNKQDSQGSQDQQNSLLPSSIEQTQAQKPSQDTSGKQNSDQTDQKEPQKPVPALVTKQENSGTELKGNGITEIGDSYVLKEYKQFVISIIVILIPITLTILYKVNKRKL